MPDRRPSLSALTAASIVLVAGCASEGASGPPSGKPAAFEQTPSLIAELLAGLEPDRGEVVRAAFDRTDADRRQAAVLEIAAARWGGGEAILPVYRLLLTDPDPTVRAAAASALGRHGGPGDAPAVAEQLKQPDAFLRWEAAKALRFLPSESTVPALLSVLLNDEDVGTRVAAAEALGRYPRRDVYEALRTALLDADFAVTAAAEASLSTLTGADLGTAPEPWRELADERGAGLFANARPYEPRPYREPPGFFGKLLGR